MIGGTIVTRCTAPASVSREITVRQFSRPFNRVPHAISDAPMTRTRPAKQNHKSASSLETRLKNLPAPLIARALEYEGLVIDAVTEERIRAHVPPARTGWTRRLTDWLRGKEIVVERRPSRLHVSSVPDYRHAAMVALGIGFSISLLFSATLTVWLLQGILLSGAAIALVYVWSATTVPSPVVRALVSLMEDELAGVRQRAR